MKKLEVFNLKKIQNYINIKAQTMLHCWVWGGD